MRARKMNTDRREASPVDVTLCAALAQGGIAHYSYALAEALQSAGLETSTLMYDSPAYDLTEFPHSHRVLPRLRLATSPPSRLTSLARNLGALMVTARSSKIVHFQWSLGARNDRLDWPVLRRLGKRVVYTAHGVLPHEPEIMSEAHCRWIYRSADALIVHGMQPKEILVSHFDIDASKIQVIPHGNYNFVADTPGPWTRARARESFGWNDDDRVVLFFGLIRAYKGLDTLLEACRLVQDRRLRNGQRLRLLIVGRDFKNHWAEGGYDAMIRSAGLSDTVRLHLEHVSMREIPRFFQAADVVALPYKKGTQSGVLQLAYSFGKAAVATRVGSLVEVSSSEIARFVDPECPAELAEAIRALLLDSSVADDLGAKARQYVDTVLGWDEIARTTKALYASLL
jgi:D-inositol-3-phosphate glycosyltransferase